MFALSLVCELVVLVGMVRLLGVVKRETSLDPLVPVDPVDALLGASGALLGVVESSASLGPETVEAFLGALRLVVELLSIETVEGLLSASTSEIPSDSLVL